MKTQLPFQATRLPFQRCLACGHKMDAHAQLAEPDEPDGKPEPDDITICIRCGCVMAFDDKLRFRHLTVAEIAEMEQDKRVQHAVRSIGRLDGKPRRQ